MLAFIFPELKLPMRNALWETCDTVQEAVLIQPFIIFSFNFIPVSVLLIVGPVETYSPFESGLCNSNIYIY